jgi:hypothetical protein
MGFLVAPDAGVFLKKHLERKKGDDRAIQTTDTSMM